MYIAIVIFSVLFMVALFIIQRFTLNRTTAAILIVYYILFIVLGVLFSFPTDSPVINLQKIPSANLPSL